MSEEQDSWFKSAFGVDLNAAVNKIKEDAAAIAGAVAAKASGVVQDVQNAAASAVEAVTGETTVVAKKVAAGGAPSSGGSAGGTAGGSFPIGGSVGRGGQNAPNDVRAVQGALGISADGQCGSQTIGAIETFQRNMGMAQPDGRVDSGGATERALTGGGPRAPDPPATPAPTPVTPEAADEGGILERVKKGAEEVIGTAAGEAWDAASKVAGGAVEFVEKTASAIADAASEVVEDVKEAVSPTSDQAVEGLEQAKKSETEERIFDSATNMTVNIEVADDRTWSYTWQWTYGGNRSLTGVSTELLLTDQKGLVLDAAKEATHSMEPGQTAIGGGSGNLKLRQGRVTWKLLIPYKSGYIGIAGGVVGEDPSLAPEDRVYDTARNMQVTIDVQTDGTWSYTWSWFYAGNKDITGVSENLMIFDEKGVMFDLVVEAAHSMKPQQTALGGGGGHRQLRGGKVTWKLAIPYKESYIGDTSGSFFAAVAEP